MSYTTILLFFLYTWGLGYSATSLTQQAKNPLERNIMRMGIGLGVLAIVLIILNLMRIPLDWKIVLAISLIPPLAIALRQKSLFNIPNLRLNKSSIYIAIVTLLALATLFMHQTGAFSYPYFEDTDPWEHGLGAKFVANEKTLNMPPHVPDGYLAYISPYPPGYDAIMGILHQTSPSLVWTVKFFNALIISSAILFFYFFAKLFTRNSTKALIATFIFAMLPSFLSHFIWAHSLAVVMFFPMMYCIEKMQQDKKWIIPSILVIAAIWVSQPTQPIKIAILLGIYFLFKSLVEKKIRWDIIAAQVGGVLLSFSWWAFNLRAMFQKGVKSAGASSGLLNRIQNRFSPGSGTASRSYNFDDFFVANHTNLINNPIGIGKAVSVLIIIGIFILIGILIKNLLKNKPHTSWLRWYASWIMLAITGICALVSVFGSLIGFAYLLFFLILSFFLIKNDFIKEKNNTWILITLGWMLFTFLGINSLTFGLPFGLFAFRFWMLFAIMASLLSVVAIIFLSGLSKNQWGKIAITVILLISVYFTAGTQKYSVNTAQWGPDGRWSSPQELGGYLWLKQNLPPNTKVYPYSGEDSLLTGMDMFVCGWCEETFKLREDIFAKDPDQIHQFLKSNNYQYLLLDGMSFRTLAYQYGENKTNEELPVKFEAIVNSEKFSPTHQTQGLVILRVV